jgi:flagellar basal body P-ring formation protein FlgA
MLARWMLVLLAFAGLATVTVAIESADPDPDLSTEATEKPAQPGNRLLGENELNSLLAGVLQRDHVRETGELELTFVRSWTPVTVPDSELTLKILELPTLGVTPNFIVRFELFAGEKSLGSWQVPLRARIWRDVWVARAALHRGDLLANTDRTRERRDVLALRNPYGSDSNVDETMLELAEDVPAGLPILAKSVRPRTLVRRGQVVEAFVRDGAMAISLKVEVLENGAHGQQVRVRNVQSRREFRGIVENENTISVSL